MSERTLVLVKPDGVARGLVGEVLSRIERNAAVALFGFAALFGKWIAWDPVAIVLGRTVVAAIALGAWLRWRRTPMLRPSVALALSGDSARTSATGYALLRRLEALGRARGCADARAVGRALADRHRLSHFRPDTSLSGFQTMPG